MNEQKKRQLIKALAYDTDREQIKSVMNVSDEDIDGITAEEIETEKNITREWGILNE